MFIQRLRNLPILYLLIIGLLISPAVTSGSAWVIAADNHSLRNEVVAGACESDNYVENSAYRWGNQHSRQGHQPGSLLACLTAAALLAQDPLSERQLNNHRIVHPSPRIPDHILYHRTTVLLI